MKKEQLIKAGKSLVNFRTRSLDLTSRNSLINFWRTKSLRIIVELPNQLDSVLLSEVEMSIFSVPKPAERELINAGYLKLNEITHRIERVKDHSKAIEAAGLYKSSQTILGLELFTFKESNAS